MTKKRHFLILRALDALVAQLDRVLGYEPSGRRFESFRVRHLTKLFLFEAAGQSIRFGAHEEN